MKRFPRRLLAATAVAMLLAMMALLTWSCAPSFSSATTDRLSARVKQGMAAGKIPGSVSGARVSSRGDWLESFGKADARAGTAMKTGDRFRIASITKTFTGTMVLMLADDGKLALDDKVAKYLPGIPNAENITIRQLLNHTSGIADEDPNGVLHDYFKDTSSMFKQWTPEEVVQAYTGGNVQGQPGEGYEYSNAGYVVLGMIIEKASGRKVPDFCREKITGPLGLKDTYFPTGPDMTGRYAHGYDGTKDVTRMDMSWDFTAGAMVSTAPDLNVWAKALATGQLLSPGMHRQQLAWVDIPGTRGQARYGLGIEYQFGWLGHGGANVGYQSEMWYYPVKDSTVVVMMNKLSSDGSDAGAATKTCNRLIEVLFPGFFPEWYWELVGD